MTHHKRVTMRLYQEKSGFMERVINLEKMEEDFQMKDVVEEKKEGPSFVRRSYMLRFAMRFACY